MVPTNAAPGRTSPTGVGAYMRPLAPPTDSTAGRAHTARMSDQPLVWKFAFGVLVLLFCAVTFLTRKDTESTPSPILAPVPAASASAPPEVVDPVPDAAPADVRGVQDEPVRVSVSVHQPPVVKKHRVARHAIRKVLHRRHHRLSPYVAGRQHYPFDPKERWLSPLG
jgi:hypothetical protein